jgi:hypothetical protein
MLKAIAHEQVPCLTQKSTAVDEASDPSRKLAHEDVLGDGDIGHDLRLLADDVDAERARLTR